MKLEDLKNKNPFLVPDGYFENFPDLIMAKIKEEEKSKKNIRLNVNFTSIIRKTATIAAAAIILLSITITQNKVKNENYSDDLIEAFLDMYSISEVETYILSELYSENQ